MAWKSSESSWSSSWASEATSQRFLRTDCAYVVGSLALALLFLARRTLRRGEVTGGFAF